MRAVSVTEMARNFSEYVNRVVFRGERFLLTRGNREVAELRPRRQGTSLRDVVAALRGGPQLTSSEADAFRDDVDKARSRAARLPVRNVWGK